MKQQQSKNDRFIRLNQGKITSAALSIITRLLVHTHTYSLYQNNFDFSIGVTEKIKFNNDSLQQNIENFFNHFNYCQFVANRTVCNNKLLIIQIQNTGYGEEPSEFYIYYYYPRLAVRSSKAELNFKCSFRNSNRIILFFLVTG